MICVDLLLRLPILMCLSLSGWVVRAWHVIVVALIVVTVFVLFLLVVLGFAVFFLLVVRLFLFIFLILVIRQFFFYQSLFIFLFQFFFSNIVEILEHRRQFVTELLVFFHVLVRQVAFKSWFVNHNLGCKVVLQ